MFESLDAFYIDIYSRILLSQIDSKLQQNYLFLHSIIVCRASTVYNKCKSHVLEIKYRKKNWLCPLLLNIRKQNFSHIIVHCASVKFVEC